MLINKIYQNIKTIILYDQAEFILGIKNSSALEGVAQWIEH